MGQMSQTSRPIGRKRQIGPWGTTARAGVGVGLLALAVAGRPTAVELVVGLVVAPTLVLTVLAVRGPRAPELRLHQPWAHAANLVVVAAFVIVAPTAAALFYGSSMVLAAWSGIGACEVFVVSNLLRNRDDQLACPLFFPVDRYENRGCAVPE